MGNVTSTLDIVLQDDVTKNAAQIDAALKKIASEAKAVDGVLASSGASDKFAAGLKRIGAGVTHVEVATKAWQDYAKAEGLAADRGQWTKEQISGVRAWESVTLSGVRAVMGAERALEEQRARGSAERQREMAAEQRAQLRQYEQEQRLHHRAMEQREHGISHHGIVNYALQSAALAVSAHELVHLGAEAWQQGAEVQHERIGLQNAGRTPEEIRDIERASRGVIGSTPTAGFVESLKTVAETTAAFGSVEHAINNLPFISKMTSILKTAGGDNIHGDAAALGQAFAKTFEERQTKAENFEAEAKQMIPAMVATGGTFNPEQLYAFAQQAKSALPSLSMRFLSRIAPSLIGAQGGERAGTGLKAFEDVIAGKVNDKKQAEAFLNLGLLDKNMAIMKAGHAVGWKSGAVKDTFLAMTDPLAWSEKYLIPALQKQGVDTNSREATQMILNTMFRNQNANMFATEIAQAASIARLHKDEDLYGKVGSFDEIYARNLQDFGVAAGALKSALGNLAGAVTAPLMGKVSAGLITLADGINHLSKMALEHPTIAATGGVIAAGGALSAAGVAAASLYNGFGLRGSATALDAAAAHLMEVGGGPGGFGKAGGVVPAGGAVTGAVGVPAAVELGAAVVAGVGAAAVVETVKKSFEAQGAGKGGLYAPATPATEQTDRLNLADLQAERDELARKVADQKAQEKLPGTSDTNTFADRARIAQLDSAIAQLKHSLGTLFVSPDLEAARGRAMMGFGSTPAYVDREAERGRAYMSLRRPEEFGPDEPVPGIEGRTLGAWIHGTRGSAAAGNMPAATPPPASVDTSGLDAVKAKAGEAHAALDGLNVNIAPTASLAALDAIIAKAHEARAAIAEIGSAGGATPASFNPRRSFSPASHGDRFSA